jgi:hypothetical protein
MALAVNEMGQEVKAFLPAICTRIPGPADERVETHRPVGGKPLVPVVHPLLNNPPSESVIAIVVVRWHAGMAHEFNETLEQSKPKLP